MKLMEGKLLLLRNIKAKVPVGYACRDNIDIQNYGGEM